MAMPQFSMRELIESGVHFGHKTKRWNPKMAGFLYGVRHDIHIIDLQQTVPMLHAALQAVRDTVAKNGRILFVGTKRQAQDPVSEAATRCGQHFINHRWLGGMLTNWKTIQNSIKTLRKLEENLESGQSGFTKKELLAMTRQKTKLEASLGGIKDMGGLPNLLFIIDTNKEHIAVSEAQRLGIPIVAVLDSNSAPDGITYPIPGNDDATRAIRLYCQLVAEAALDGIQEAVVKTGADLGAAEELPFNKKGKFKQAEPAKEEIKEAPKDASGEKKGPSVVVKKSKTIELSIPETVAEAEEEPKPAKKAVAKKEAGEKKPAAKKPATAKKPAAKKKAS